jgi:hypothetical protein
MWLLTTIHLPSQLTSLIMIIGSSRYALDISTKCTKLKLSRAEVFVALRFAC